MSAREYTAYEWTCDACGDTEVDEIDGIPDGWETEDDGDYCAACSPTTDPSTRSGSTGSEATS